MGQLIYENNVIKNFFYTIRTDNFEAKTGQYWEVSNPVVLENFKNSLSTFSFSDEMRCAYIIGIMMYLLTEMGRRCKEDYLKMRKTLTTQKPFCDYSAAIVPMSYDMFMAVGGVALCDMSALAVTNPLNQEFSNRKYWNKIVKAFGKQLPYFFNHVFETQDAARVIAAGEKVRFVPVVGGPLQC